MSLISPPEQPTPSTQSVEQRPYLQRQFPWLYALWKFSRPHTILGTSFSLLGIALLTWAINPSRIPYPPLLIPLALLACLCGNLYIVGLNQMEDVAIDRINKPHLPIASGEFTRSEGWRIVLFSGLVALVLSLTQGIFLTLTVWLSLLIGTAYSLPPIRLKRFPFWASFCILVVRGVIVNLGLFCHFASHQGEAMASGSLGIPVIPPVIWLLMALIVGFSIAIALFKDIPDLEGDRHHQISTFSLKLGTKTVFNLALGLLTACYAMVVAIGATVPHVNPVFIVASHACALIALWVRRSSADLSDRPAISRFYQFIWQLFFLEYLFFPVSALLW
ncbi:MAG: homogentisate phytyltransferase [Oculatellaceae cyanobacterium Prado106]|jgi:homogentisate phytyltransferase/homogentisate geranylgeranyltransferase|nr:homogentisate phytyltransferase [Oculatellaceae cyanobacterium Prado106]